MTTTKWKYNDTTQFRRDYKNLRNPQIQEKVKEAIRNILESENPRRLGIHKINNMDCIYGYELGLQYRILYEVLDTLGKREVVFYRVGLHNIYKSTIRRIT
jgi:mRNA-degrading endonuclease RelE of RelBE toxin-antitoxin system